jgi:hypothetical protein
MPSWGEMVVMARERIQWATLLRVEPSENDVAVLLAEDLLNRKNHALAEAMPFGRCLPEGRQRDAVIPIFTSINQMFADPSVTGEKLYTLTVQVVRPGNTAWTRLVRDVPNFSIPAVKHLREGTDLVTKRRPLASGVFGDDIGRYASTRAIVANLMSSGWGFHHLNALPEEVSKIMRNPYDHLATTAIAQELELELKHIERLRPGAQEIARQLLRQQGSVYGQGDFISSEGRVALEVLGAVRRAVARSECHRWGLCCLAAQPRQGDRVEDVIEVEGLGCSNFFVCH